MNDIGNKPMVSLKITDPVPDNEWVELDVLLLAKLMAIVPANISYETPVVMPDSKSKILARARSVKYYGRTTLPVRPKGVGTHRAGAVAKAPRILGEETDPAEEI